MAFILDTFSPAWLAGVGSRKEIGAVTFESLSVGVDLCLTLCRWLAGRA
jgi:hypothetical protein